jgi:hypothetical protein
VIEVGQQFGRWRVIARGESLPRHGATWRMRCECGTVRLVRADNLTAGTSNSCRCLQRDLVAARNRARLPIRRE